jgi:plasmid stability protein
MKTLTLDDELDAALEAAAARDGRSKEDLAAEALRRFLGTNAVWTHSAAGGDNAPGDEWLAQWRALGEEIGQAWNTDKSATEILSEMRR